jgi:uncharacterized protein (TIGR04141 family)
MEEKKHRTDFTIYLAKPNVSVSSDIIKNEDTLKSLLVSIGKQNIGTLFIKLPHFNPPRWAKYFDAVITQDEFGCNASTAAVFLVESNNRLFIITFGHGHHLVNSEFIEMNFGLRVALNKLDVDSLRSIDKATFEAHPTQSREQSGKATAIQYFGLDIERDLLRALTGMPKDKSYGERLSGMDAVKLSVAIDLPALKDFLSKLLIAYEDDSYKKGAFSWVDHIGLIKDARLVALLDQQLIAKIAANEIDKIWLSVPEIIDWNRVVGFKYSKSKNATRYSDIRIPEFIETLNNIEINKELLLRKKILCVDADDLPVLERSSYYFIYAELIIDSKIYLLNNGKWYLINQDFTQQINTFYSSIKLYEKTLPVYDDETEGHYNSRVAEENPEKYFLFHGKNIHLSGQAAPVEPCDLYSCDQEFIHVKRYGGSSVLSHLFNQGLVSGELFQRESNYRLQLNDKLTQQYKLPDVSERLVPEKYTIVYAIISEHDEDLSIPFFSKISLRHAVNRLESMGFKVKLAKISVAENKKKIKKCPAKKVKF